MPFCTNCGKENKVEAKFCTSCGAIQNAKDVPTIQKQIENKKVNDESTSQPIVKQNKSKNSSGTIFGFIIIIAIIVFTIYKCSDSKDEKYAKAIIGTWIIEDETTKEGLTITNGKMSFYPNKNFLLELTLLSINVNANGSWEIKDGYLCTNILSWNIPNMPNLPSFSRCYKLIEINDEIWKMETDGAISISHKLKSPE